MVSPPPLLFAENFIHAGAEVGFEFRRVADIITGHQINIGAAWDAQRQNRNGTDPAQDFIFHIQHESVEVCQLIDLIPGKGGEDRERFGFVPDSRLVEVRAVKVHGIDFAVIPPANGVPAVKKIINEVVACVWVIQVQAVKPILVEMEICVFFELIPAGPDVAGAVVDYGKIDVHVGSLFLPGAPRRAFYAFSVMLMITPRTTSSTV